MLGDAAFEPAIYYFDEDDQLLIKLENQTIVGNRVSASVEHFSRYMLLNKNIHSKVWEFEFKFDEDSTETFENLDIAFYDYISIAHSRSKEYYVSGHSLGGRLTQDAIYKIYNSNEGVFGAFKTDIPVPKYSATFNGLGYNRLVYTALENDIIAQYKNTLYNYYFSGDMVGEILGAGAFRRTGTDIGPWMATYEDGTEIPISPIGYEPSKLHGINLFHWNSKMFYPQIPNRN